MRHAGSWMAVFMAAACTSASAQVFKCKDKYGQVLYSDTGCASMQSGHLMDRQNSLEQKHQQRAKAFQEQEARKAREKREKEREARAADALKVTAGHPASTYQAPGPAASAKVEEEEDGRVPQSRGHAPISRSHDGGGGRRKGR